MGNDIGSEKKGIVGHMASAAKNVTVGAVETLFLGGAVFLSAKGLKRVSPETAKSITNAFSAFFEKHGGGNLAQQAMGRTSQALTTAGRVIAERKNAAELLRHNPTLL